MPLDVELIGPFTEHRVAVGGRRVPFLTAHQAGDGWNLVLDGRLALHFMAEADMRALIPFIADAIAIGMGYASHPTGDDEATPRPDFPRMVRIDLADAAPGLRLVTAEAKEETPDAR